MKFGAKLWPIGSPFASTKRPDANTEPAAASTPSTFLTLCEQAGREARRRRVLGLHVLARA